MNDSANTATPDWKSSGSAQHRSAHDKTAIKDLIRRISSNTLLEHLAEAINQHASGRHLFDKDPRCAVRVLLGALT